MEYMGTFYGKVTAAGLVKNGFCTIDSCAVLRNVERLRANEELEKKKRSVAADGLVSMQNPAGATKRAYKFLDPSELLLVSLNEKKQIIMVKC